MRISLWLIIAPLGAALPAWAQTCTFTLSPSAVFLDASAQSSNIAVTASAQNCAWSASSTGFIGISSGATGTGDGAVSFTVPANTSTSDLKGTLTIAGQPVAVTQRFTPTTFANVGPSNNFFDAVNLLSSRSITAGCRASPLLYCPDENISRDEMAVFIIRSIFGADNFTYSATPYFTDVSENYPYFKWIQKMKELGITDGCTATEYCPLDDVTRDEMAIFIIAARYGASTAFSYPSTPYFSDVSSSDRYFRWIQKMRQIGITDGCTATLYCPDSPVTRGEMAVFIMVGEFNQLFPPTTPVITLVTPASAAPGSSVTVNINGSGTNFVQGTTSVAAGAGIAVTNVTVASLTSLTATFTVSSGAALNPASVIVTTGSEEAVLPNGFSIVPPGPSITSISPISAAAGALVTVVGSNLAPTPTVTLNQQGGGTVAAPVLSANPNSLSFVVPSNAATGPVNVSAGGLTTASPASLTITGGAIFTLSVSPGVVNLIQGQSAALAIQINSSTGFNSLANLSLAGLPTGVTASFSPSSITAGQTAVVMLTAPANQAIATSNLTVTAAAVANSIPISQSANAQLAVVPPTTSFVGRTVVSDAQQTPLAGVNVTMLGLDGGGNATDCTGSTISDGAGNFALTNLPSACLGPQLIGFGGNNVTSPPGKYAGVNLVFTLLSGQVVVSPILVHLPRIDGVETFSVQQNFATDQTYSFATIPGLSVTVYAHTTFTESDGSQPNPFPLAAIQVPVDRLPDIMPPTTAGVAVFIVAFQPANTVASRPVAVSFPNSLNTAPGTDLPLMTLDPTLGRMVPYGTGTVSSDGRTIVPDIDPSTGALQHRFGIVHFDWHGPMSPPPPGMNPAPPGSGSGPCSDGGNPAGASGAGGCTPTKPTVPVTPTPAPPCNSCPCSTPNQSAELLQFDAPASKDGEKDLPLLALNLPNKESGLLPEPSRASW